MIIETHCHLDYLKERPLEETLQLALDAGVEKIITIAVEPANFDVVRDLAKKYPQVYYSQGTHPHDAKDCTDESLKKIRERVSDPKMVAIGEIGLDYYYDNSPRDKQQEIFHKHLSLAQELKKPVIIHSRDAEEDTIEILKQYDVQGVIHSFTSKIELAEFAIKKGLYIGFNGIITFKNANNVRDVLEIVPMAQILSETDSPFLTPVPHRGKENAPHYLPHVIEKIAEVKKLDLKEVQEQLKQNAIHLFKF